MLPQLAEPAGAIAFTVELDRDVFFDGSLAILPGRVSLPAGSFKVDPLSTLTGFVIDPVWFEQIVVLGPNRLAGQGTFTFLGSGTDAFGNPQATARYDFAATPEPSTLMLLAAAIATFVRGRGLRPHRPAR